MRLTGLNLGVLKGKHRPTKGAGRRPQNENVVKFKELIPLQLKNKVSTKGEKTSGAGCIQEMAVMFACLKENNFAEPVCATEIKTFKDCYQSHMENAFQAKKQSSSGTLIPGAKSLPANSLNKLLRRYPQTNDPSVTVRNP